MLILLAVIGIWIGYGIVETRVKQKVSEMENGLTDLNELLH
jgi:hypothetical protein